MSSEVKPPIWARPEPRSRGLSRKQIVETALKIADEEGLAEVSIRRIARELRSGAMSLYHYFDSRDELLDLMGDSTAVDDYTVGFVYRELAGGGSADRGREIAARFRTSYNEPHIRYLLESGEFP